ncbi:DAK2 domain-containing protein [Rhodococcus sp. IEGM 1408]|uniref:DAK2 domain-containing protein n=1 Tax=Rhodococcus sp. IEGM 1408 TaxID=3082220 RepID=UPI002953D30E|nr:DAK2 domain-containing protein [Rhodococcus sp. IEGM 1408]MDV8000483.1 DAK2 domain-containing protein [Rhodococcus sp. IEGM 1408]
MTPESTRVEERPSSLDAHGLLGWARRCVEQLATHREEINALNVFPVPDADTGTNLLYTMRAAVERAEGEEAWISEGGGSAGAREIAVALGHGAVHGARGNSGVILSQVLRAVGEAATFTVLDASTYRRALRTAVTLVNHAISDPVEGTIVTVLREAAAGAVRSSASSLAEVARAAADAGAQALDRTTSQLPALARAGVVDAGGRGLLILLDTMVEVLLGEAPERPDYFIPADQPSDAATRSDPSAAATGRDGSEVTRYEVMYSLTHSDDARADEVRSALRTLGDSVGVVGDGGTGDNARWAVHVHTNDIGTAIEVALPLGRITEIRVTDMLDPVHAPAAVDHADGHTHADDRLDGHLHADGHGRAPERAVVAIVPSGPLADLFAEAGAHTVDPGENADGVVDAVLAVSAEELLVLPNGELSRAQIGALDAALREVDGQALILPTGSAVQGLSALAVHDPSTTLSLDGFGMADAAAATRHAHLVRAEQDALTMVGRCDAGDLLGVVGHDVALIHTDLVDAVCALAERLLSSGGELVTLLLGEEYDEAASEAALSRLRNRHPDVEVVGYAAGPGRVLAHVGVE